MKNEQDTSEATDEQEERPTDESSRRDFLRVGGVGLGKTHLATAIAVQAIQQHRYRVRFLQTIELVNALEQEKQADLSVDR